jgi:cell division protein FtsB
MNPRPSFGQRVLQIVLLAVLVVFAFWFLSGPNGLVSIARRHHRLRQAEADIARFKKEIKQTEHERDLWLDPDTARARAHRLLDPDTTGTNR